MPATNEEALLKDSRLKLVEEDIQLNRLLDELLVCGSRKDIDALLVKSRKMFTNAERHLESMETTALSLRSEQDIDTCRTEITERKKQFKSLNQEIKSAVAQRLVALEKQQRSELLDTHSESKSQIAVGDTSGARKFLKQEDILKNNSQMTENLSRITRTMTQEIKQSEETISTLATSSETLSRASDEFQTMGLTIQQGGHLIDKYDRRQFADKAIITLAFTFFFLVCGYIINGRLFGGFNWLSFFIEFFFPSNEPDLPILVKREL